MNPNRSINGPFGSDKERNLDTDYEKYVRMSTAPNAGSGYFTEDNSEDLSYSELDTFPEFVLVRSEYILNLQLDHNQISVLPNCISCFVNLVSLDVSNNRMTLISDEILKLNNLRSLTAKNNLLDASSLPKDFGRLSLQVLNFSGNRFAEFPMQILELSSLKCLYFGANRLETIPREIGALRNLEILYLGGNRLSSVPEELGYLSLLSSLHLCDNFLQSLPCTLVNLRELKSLSLHNNRLSTLPPSIVRLRLNDLSLRNNPLIMRFVEDLVYDVPSLRELSARSIKLNKVDYSDPGCLPSVLLDYLDSAKSCVNPACKGVYFTSCVEQVKFVDFCGKYRLPLLEYLCSPRCSKALPDDHQVLGETSDSEELEGEAAPMAHMMKKVLLG